MASLTLERLTKIYGSGRKPAAPAVDSVDLAAEDGEIIGLLGSSGCGKTSTLRMIAGFEAVSGGRILVGERPVEGLLPALRGVAMAFEGYALYPPLKVRDNIGFALLRERRPRAEIEARVAEVAALLEIEPILERYPPTISAGQQQRTSLARALVRRAPVSLLDEPMSQLEPQLRAILRARVKDYLSSNRMTTVFVTHDQTEAIALADRIAVMEKGVLQQYATPQALKDAPANLFVASFIGEPPMNIVAAEAGQGPAGPQLHVLDGGGMRAFTLELGQAMLGAELARRIDGGRLRLGIRPHRVELGAADGMPAAVLSNQWLGDQTHLALDLRGVPIVAVAHRPVAARVGESLAVGLPGQALHVFDADTGDALAHGLPARPGLAA